jgi:carboxyl-terminal processing protease
MRTPCARVMQLVRLGLALAVPALAAEPGKASTAEERTLDAGRTAETEASIVGKLSGIGATLVETNGWIAVAQAQPETPAARAGLAPGTVIVAINGISTKGMQLADAVKLVRGPAGTSVALDLRSATGETTHREIVRETMVLNKPQVSLLPNSIGSIQLRGFNDQTPSAVREALSSLQAQGAKALILDLRGSQSGSLTAIQKVAELFLQPGQTLWLFEDQEGNRNATKAAAAAAFALPMVAFIDGTTLGGELVAAALKRNQRAVLIGQRTTGTTKAKKMIGNPDGSSRLIVLGTFLISPKEPISGAGVEPDVALDPGASADDFMRAAKTALNKPRAARP